MNAIFSTLFLVCACLLLFISPDSFLPTLLESASKSAALCLSLLATYSVWMGLMQVWEDSGLSKSFSSLLRPFSKKFFKVEDSKTLDAVCMNLSVNMLGISGAGTPYGIKAVNLLDKAPQAEYASAMFFVLNATSLQLFPTSLIAVKIALHSANPNDIILPIILTSAFSTLLGVILTKGYFSLKKPREKQSFSLKSKGAGI